MADKLKVGWFSFSCCEDSTIIFTELLNDHYRQWKNVIDFRSIIVMQKREDLSELDVAFVEGAITGKDQEEKLKKIRQVSKKLVAVGSCAVAGNPSNWRNTFDEKTKQEIEAITTRFAYCDRVSRLDEIVPVDDRLPGCPMKEEAFLALVDKYLEEFGISVKNGSIGRNSDGQ